jgi:hypothetical protein
MIFLTSYIHVLPKHPQRRFFQAYSNLLIIAIYHHMVAELVLALNYFNSHWAFESRWWKMALIHMYIQNTYVFM